MNKICIICEGFEEFDYLIKLNNLAVWNKAYNIVIRNAKGIDNIVPIYQHIFQNNNYDLIVIFCDTELYPFLQIKNIHKKINAFHGKKVAERIVFFANPCSMQIVLSHFRDVALCTNSKVANGNLIRDLTGVKNYAAHAEQRHAMMNLINARNYETMKSNIAILPTDYKVCPSTNFLSLLFNLESQSPAWISKLAKRIEKF